MVNRGLVTFCDSKEWTKQAAARGAKTALAKLPSLTTLDVESNKIGDEGAAALGARAGLTVAGMDDQY
jgi:hypothetical protein